MTIQRQYSLPNCTLVLEGLSDPTASMNPAEMRPLMSILINAECRISGREQPISGGRDFFVALVAAVSRYAQEFLSGIHLPVSASAVQIHGVDRKQHRLVVQPPEDAAKETTRSTQVDLNTVQLFDLVDAIDQFFADAQTLPDLTLQLAPVSKRYTAARQITAERVVPAAIGVSSLALTAVALFFIPIPEVQKPKDPTPQSNTSQSQEPSPTGAASPSPQTAAALQTSPTTSPTTSPAASTTPSPASTTQPNLEDVQAALAAAPEITDPTQLNSLSKKVYDQIDQSWKQEPEFEQELVYRVSVAQDGAILGYREAENTPTEAAQQTPLLDLLYIPANGGSLAQEPVGQFRVVFRPNGVLQVSPWGGYSAPPSPNSEITDSSAIEDLTGKLYDQIDRNWKEKPTFERELVYRVNVAPDGSIANYEPVNQPGSDYVEDTPLPTLLKSDAAPAQNDSAQNNSAQNNSAQNNAANQASLAPFKVVFKPNGVLQVSPWRGYQ
ncbi:DUF4335 domain-containing protein [Trichocoleus sp. FACHB-591]|uniref:DUF4335 domain-containing protein n=1 Tax=Trichocoleus sp. FACHB-591 TaxID=2692872 RepID=UPI0016837B7B|nr:DUF4335 domain-containing protein [Trichocoleus sp. FACHB-591]MBD2098646.1 DUF4335 domain-containing protein [Trichocoleus sp. FACHB-591]